MVLAGRIVLGALGVGAGIDGVDMERQDQGGAWKIMEDTTGIGYTLKTSNRFTIWHGCSLKSDGVKLRFNNTSGIDATDFVYLYVEDEVA